MNKKLITNELFLEIYNDTKTYPTLNHIADYFDQSYNFVKGRIEKLRKLGYQNIADRQKLNKQELSHHKKEPITYNIDEIASPENKTIERLQKELKDLKGALDEAKGKIFETTDLKELMDEVTKKGFETTPKWFEEKSNSHDSLVPVLFLTDTHIGEVIEASDMGYVEAYNEDIAVKSVNKLVDDFISICTTKMNNYHYDGVVLMLGGDMITGDLHDLSETNDLTPIEQVITATGLFIQQIKKLKASFGKVQIFAVTGNHGRLDAHNYTKTKKRVDNSLESLVYFYINEHFSEDKDVCFVYDKADEIRFGISGRKFLLTHGDRGIKGGGGIGGIVPPVKRARAKMLQNAVAMNREFDTLVIGHFHQHFISEDIIIGASTKPFDGYCKSLGLEYNKAGATSFFVNTHGEIIFATKLIVRDENRVVIERKKQLELF